MVDCKSCSHYEPQDAITIECVGNVLSERIKVFISSAQRNEKGFAWEETRRRIKEKLANQKENGVNEQSLGDDHLSNTGWFNKNRCCF